ncbi:conserved hypothetical protein [Histoplasma capsulatum H143]|uniref:Peptidase M16 N-terminal domain-containing protein n=1 Tax=Ajellomyces capsulatus (strain H143) TaxID=544712 RepID=C6HFA0_AJECH|nr:conserved hypothetical protein [Histoplasma capsulatum H143]
MGNKLYASPSHILTPIEAALGHCPGTKGEIVRLHACSLSHHGLAEYTPLSILGIAVVAKTSPSLTLIRVRFGSVKFYGRRFAVIGRHLSTSTTLPAQQPLHHHQQQQQQIHPLFPKPQHTMAIVERLTEDLEKPSVDDRSYRVIRLPNKLEALLVHDPDTDKASASVNVNVGNFSDDDDLPGIAHAVEHALFMGTKKKMPTTST